MSAAAQRLGCYPATLYEWELVLTHALLHVNGGDADPIRSFEITPETLALYCGLGGECAAGAEHAFKRALVNDPYLYWSLKHGAHEAPTAEVPNCLAILSLSLLVDSLLDGKYEGQGQYRAKLAQWLGTHQSLMDLRGIATMWEGLAAWLDGRIEAGAPFRRLVLPDIPTTWTHIGYTRYLSFPTKRDVTFLRTLAERHPNVMTDAAALVRLVDPLLCTSTVSLGLRDAFNDFRAALRAGTVSIDHRFWRLVTLARQLAGQKEAPQVSLIMEFDEDGRRYYRINAVGTSSSTFLADIGSAVALPAVAASQNLGPAVRRGILILRPIGLASWAGAAEPPSGIGQFHIAVADRQISLAAGAIARFERSGTWHITAEPISVRTVEDILWRLGIRDAKETVCAIELGDGIRVGTAWLGFPRYLPQVQAGAGDIDVRPPLGATGPTLTCIEGKLRADGPVEGDFAIGDKAGRWLRHASFVVHAQVHVSMDASAYSLPVQEECLVDTGVRVSNADSVAITWDERPYDHQDMLEALYASSRSGIGEGDAVAIVGRAAGRRTWDMLRTLQEASFLEARLRERWRGRVFTLGRPTCVEVNIGSSMGVVVSGALPMRLERDFRETVILQGGIPFRRLGDGSQAPALLGALGVDPARLANALGWTVAEPPKLLVRSAAIKLAETKVIGENYRQASKWDWSSGHFRVGAAESGPVSLSRFVHPSGRDHDLYRVSGAKLRTFTSRYAAILDAHLQANRPLFRLNGNTIQRIPAEGALPLEISQVLRLHSLTNGGASVDGWEYLVRPHDSRWLAGLMPGLIEGLSSGDDTALGLLERRGRGSRRPLWIDGSIAAV